MHVLLFVLAVTTVLGSMIGAIQTGAQFWQGGLIGVFGLSAIELFYIIMSVIYPSLASNPVLAIIVFLVTVEFAASHVVKQEADRRSGWWRIDAHNHFRCVSRGIDRSSNRATHCRT
ncbi:hypothetical protein [Phyllobacterium ifriqiyense]|uniref:hypothetical protein n=1 Tax=Phyllobacterium ifriqiyense TaxID=314238 RepID=UPI0033946E4D